MGIRKLDDIRLTAVQQQVLDAAATFQLSEGEAPTIDEILLRHNLKDEQATRESIEWLVLNDFLARREDDLHLTPLGLLMCRHEDVIKRYAERLLRFLREKSERDRSRFRAFDWKTLKAEGVASKDEQITWFRVVISVLNLGQERVFLQSPRDGSRWDLPKDIVGLRKIETIQGLYEHVEYGRLRTANAALVGDSKSAKERPSRAAQLESEVSSTWSVLLAAVSRVPGGKWVFGPVALGAAAAVILGFFLGSVRLAFFGVIFSFVFSVLFYVFAKGTASIGVLTGPLIFIVWAITLLFAIFLITIYTCVFWGQPRDLRHWIETEGSSGGSATERPAEPILLASKAREAMRKHQWSTAETAWEAALSQQKNQGWQIQLLNSYIGEAAQRAAINELFKTSEAKAFIAYDALDIPDVPTEIGPQNGDLWLEVVPKPGASEVFDSAKNRIIIDCYDSQLIGGQIFKPVSSVDGPSIEWKWRAEELPRDAKVGDPKAANQGLQVLVLLRKRAGYRYMMLQYVWDTLQSKGTREYRPDEKSASWGLDLQFIVLEQGVMQGSEGSDLRSESRDIYKDAFPEGSDDSKLYVVIGIGIQTICERSQKARGWISPIRVVLR